MAEFIKNWSGIITEFVMKIVEDKDLFRFFLFAEVIEVFWFINIQNVFSCKVKKVICEKAGIYRKSQIKYFILVCHIKAENFFSRQDFIKLDANISR